MYSAWQRFLHPSLSDKTKNKPLPGRICFSDERVQADAFKTQMILILSHSNIWMNPDK